MSAQMMIPDEAVASETQTVYASVRTFQRDLAECRRDGGRSGGPVDRALGPRCRARRRACVPDAERDARWVRGEVQRAILHRFVCGADDQHSTLIVENGPLLTLGDGADRLAIHAPHDALCVPVDGVLAALLDGAR